METKRDKGPLGSYEPIGKRPYVTKREILSNIAACFLALLVPSLIYSLIGIERRPFRAPYDPLNLLLDFGSLLLVWLSVWLLIRMLWKKT